jgi:hypothetical protein
VVLNSLSAGALADAAAAAWGGSAGGEEDGGAVIAAPPVHPVTPLHLAAAHPRADVSLELVELLLSRFPGAAHAAWVLSKDAAGRSPADVSFAAHPNFARLRQLDAVLRADVSVAAARVVTACNTAQEGPPDGGWHAQAPPFADQHGTTVGSPLNAQRRRAALAAANRRLTRAGDAVAAALAAHALQALEQHAAAAAPPPAASLAATLASLRRLAGGAKWRLPGAFASAEMERAWLAHSARLLRFPDRVAYPFGALTHGAQLASLWMRSGMLPTLPQAAHVFTMLLLVPCMLLFAPGCFARNREAVHAFMRLLGSFMLPQWLELGAHADTTQAKQLSPVQRWMTLFGMVFFSLAAIVRAPLHFTIQAVSFGITVGVYGIVAHLPLRLCVAGLNLTIVVLLERAWRRRFQEAWRGKKGAAAAGKVQ